MTIALSTFPGTTMNDKLIYAGINAAAGSVIDCTSYTGTQPISRTITINRSMTFVFGNVSLNTNFNVGDINTHMFWIIADNVRLEGVSRTTNSTANGYTRFVYTNPNRGYHVFVGNNVATGASTWNSYNGFSMSNIDCQGIQSVITNSGGSPTYTTTGSGGIFILSGNPSNSSSTVSNVRLDNVWVSGSRTHGILLYNAINSKLTNCRVSSTAGHGYFLYKGKGNSLDSCFATGCNLAGFKVKENTYTNLTSCASDSNGMGYVLYESLNCTMSSCGAESNVIRTTQPNNLGISVIAAATFTLNDIGAEAAFRYKGTSFWMYSELAVQGCESNSLISCYSKDPSNTLTGYYVSQYTSHFGMTGYVRNCSIISPNTAGTAVTKYKFRLDTVSTDTTLKPAFNTINYRALTYDPTNPTETANPSPLTAIATVLDQGNSNMFELAGSVKSFNDTNQALVKTDAYANVNREKVSDTLVIPTYSSHPTVPGNYAGGIYFNTTLNKLYMWNNGWYDTCCSTVTTPPCVWPSGMSYPASNILNNKSDLKMIIQNQVGYYTSSAGLGSNPYSMFGIWDMSNNATYDISNTYGIDQYEWMFDIGNNSNGDLCTYALGYIPTSTGEYGVYDLGTRIWMRNTVTGQVSYLDEDNNGILVGQSLTMANVKVADNTLWVFYRPVNGYEHSLYAIRSYSLDDLSVIATYDIYTLTIADLYKPQIYYSYKDCLIFDDLNRNFIISAADMSNQSNSGQYLFAFNIDTGLRTIVDIDSGGTDLSRGELTLYIDNDRLYIGGNLSQNIYVRDVQNGPYDYVDSIDIEATGTTGMIAYHTASEDYLFIATTQGQYASVASYMLKGFDLSTGVFTLDSQIMPFSAYERIMTNFTIDTTNGFLWLNNQVVRGLSEFSGQLLKTCLPA